MVESRKAYEQEVRQWEIDRLAAEAKAASRLNISGVVALIASVQRANCMGRTI